MYELLPASAYGTFFAVMAVVFAAYLLRSVFTYIICYYGHTFGIWWRRTSAGICSGICRS